MKTSLKKWYLLAYDIREPHRLRRIYTLVKKKGVRLQRSVFLIQANREELDQLEAGIRERVSDRVDDVRLYPVSNPAGLWAAGQQSGMITPLYAAVPLKKTTGFKKTILLLFSRRKK